MRLLAYLGEAGPIDPSAGEPRLTSEPHFLQWAIPYKCSGLGVAPRRRWSYRSENFRDPERLDQRRGSR